METKKIDPRQLTCEVKRYNPISRVEIDIAKASGPDEIAGRILKFLRKCISAPFTLLSRRAIHEGKWASICKIQRIQMAILTNLISSITVGVYTTTARAGSKNVPASI